MSTTGCGCGGGCGGCGGCGGTRSAAVGVALDGAFARPEFFAGQLLTDKDLDDLAAYVRGKNRLHNRYLHGAGVVCGLDVSPIGERSVRVSAGYVLDCCGDDIVVPCDVTVDLIALLDDLPAGCGPIGTKDEPERKYELRIEYAETATDLVAPYTSDDETAVACAPTRIREGFRFSACPVKDPQRREPTLIERLLSDAPPDNTRADLIDRVDRAAAIANELATASASSSSPAPADQLRAVLDTVAEGRDWLLRNVPQTSRDLARMTLDADDAAALRDAARKVLAALHGSVSKEICAKVNPPCPPCDDPAVALAVIAVTGCEITDVCVSVRRYVLSGPAVQHWLPVDALYDEVEKACCGTDADDTLIRRLRDISGSPAADPDPQRRLVRMLNAQVQRFEARLRKLEKGGGNA